MGFRRVNLRGGELLCCLLLSVGWEFSEWDNEMLDLHSVMVINFGILQ